MEKTTAELIIVNENQENKVNENENEEIETEKKVNEEENKKLRATRRPSIIVRLKYLNDENWYYFRSIKDTSIVLGTSATYVNHLLDGTKPINGTIVVNSKRVNNEHAIRINNGPLVIILTAIEKFKNKIGEIYFEDYQKIYLRAIEDLKIYISENPEKSLNTEFIAELVFSKNLD
jgi:hypothetical protein